MGRKRKKGAADSVGASREEPTAAVGTASPPPAGDPPTPVGAPPEPARGEPSGAMLPASPEGVPPVEATIGGHAVSRSPAAPGPAAPEAPSPEAAAAPLGVAPPAKAAAAAAHPADESTAPLPPFLSQAVALGFVTDGAARDCLRIRDEIRALGQEFSLDDIAEIRGFLSEEQALLVKSALAGEDAPSASPQPETGAAPSDPGEAPPAEARPSTATAAPPATASASEAAPSSTEAPAPTGEAPVPAPSAPPAPAIAADGRRIVACPRCKAKIATSRPDGSITICARCDGAFRIGGGAVNAPLVTTGTPKKGGDAVRVVSCPACKAKIATHLAAGTRKCPACGKGFDVAAAQTLGVKKVAAPSGGLALPEPRSGPAGELIPGLSLLLGAGTGAAAIDAPSASESATSERVPSFEIPLDLAPVELAPPELGPRDGAAPPSAASSAPQAPSKPVIAATPTPTPSPIEVLEAYPTPTEPERLGGAAADLGPGDLLGRYRVRLRLASDAHGGRYDADAPEGGRVLLRVLGPIGDHDRRARFQRRMAFLVRALEGKGGGRIAAPLARGEAGGLLYVASEKPAGRPLPDEIAARKPLPAAEASRLGFRIAEALFELHDLGLAHGALDQARIFVDGQGRVTIIEPCVERSLDAPTSEATGESVGEMDGGKGGDLRALGRLVMGLTSSPVGDPRLADVLRRLVAEDAPDPLTSAAAAAIAFAEAAGSPSLASPGLRRAAELGGAAPVPPERPQAGARPASRGDAREARAASREGSGRSQGRAASESDSGERPRRRRRSNELPAWVLPLSVLALMASAAIAWQVVRGAGAPGGGRSAQSSATSVAVASTSNAAEASVRPRSLFDPETVASRTPRETAPPGRASGATSAAASASARSAGPSASAKADPATLVERAIDRIEKALEEDRLGDARAGLEALLVMEGASTAARTGDIVTRVEGAEKAASPALVLAAKRFLDDRADLACTKCLGRRFVTCIECLGRGRVRESKELPQGFVCGECFGTGKRPCVFKECLSGFLRKRILATFYEALPPSIRKARTDGGELFAAALAKGLAGESAGDDDTAARLLNALGDACQPLAKAGTPEGSVKGDRGLVRVKVTRRGSAAEVEEKLTFRREAGAWWLEVPGAK